MKACKRQLEKDNDETMLHAFSGGPVPDEEQWWNQEENLEEAMRAWDDINNEELDPAKVMEARAEELQYVDGPPLVFVAVPESECKDKQGKPITMKWIDTR